MPCCFGSQDTPLSLEEFGHLPFPKTFIEPPLDQDWRQRPPLMKIIWHHTLNHVSCSGVGLCNCAVKYFIKVGNIQEESPKIQSLLEEEDWSIAHQSNWDSGNGLSLYIKKEGTNVHMELLQDDELLGVLVFMNADLDRLLEEEQQIAS